MIEEHISFAMQLNIAVDGPTIGIIDADRSLEAMLKNWVTLMYGPNAKVTLMINAGKQNYMLRG